MTSATTAEHRPTSQLTVSGTVHRWSHKASNGDTDDDDEDNVILADGASATGQRRSVNDSGT